jgi:hypothetical protein
MLDFQDAELLVCSVDNQLLDRVELNSGELDLSNYAPGVYILHVTAKAGQIRRAIVVKL